MKIINKLYVILFAIALMTVSCTETETEAVFNGSFVAFNAGTAGTLESSTDQLALPITMAGPLLTTDLVVDFTVSIENGTESDYTLSNTTGSLTIPAGEVADTIWITPVDNFVEDGAKVVTITLSGANESVTLGLPGPDANNKSIVVTLSDDDCAFDINAFAGDYNVEIISEVGFGNPGGSWFSTTTLSVGSDPNTLVDANWWDFGETGVITLDPSDPANLTTELVGAPQFTYFNGAGLPRYSIQGTQPLGTFNTCEASMVVNMELTREDQTTIANRSVIIYTKQ
ncbi:MAG: hypothetical protein RIM99_05725 [Cyclobacteriaceae bacterium]